MSLASSFKFQDSCFKSLVDASRFTFYASRCVMPKLIIGLVGQAGCGKGTVADFLREKHGAGYVRISGILKKLLEALGLEPSRENFVAISHAVRRQFGEDVLSHAVVRISLAASEDVVVVDGIRRLQDIAALEPLPHFKLIAIDAEPRLRFERMKRRGEKTGEADMTWEQFQEESQAETEVTIPAVMERAWKTVNNNGSKEELEAQTAALMQELV